VDPRAVTGEKMISTSGFYKGSRLVFAAVVTILAAGTIIQSSIANSESSSLRSAIWLEHPNVLARTILTRIAYAAGQGREPDRTTLTQVARLAAKQPLSPVPLLVRAALDLRAGRYARAEQAILQARYLDPRSPAARYMLADLYLRTGRMRSAMGEMAVLHRLVPGASEPLAPALAAFANATGDHKDLQAVLDFYPELGPAVLMQLSSDPKNDQLIIQLVDMPAFRMGPKLWQRNLLDVLIARGAYEEAYAIWTRLSGLQGDRSRLFNPTFATIDAPPPFNWSLTQGPGGVAESRDGGLEFLYYGREDLTLARQVLQARPGRYRLSMTVVRKDGDPQSVRWQVTCLTAPQRPLLDLPLAPRVRSRLDGEFTVPPEGCEAQALALTARAKEFPERAEFRISNLRLDSFGTKWP
jgi:hypothetical protein